MLHAQVLIENPQGPFVGCSRADHDRPDVAVGFQFLHDIDELTPHGEADGVPLAGAVEGNCGNGGLGIYENVVVQGVGIL